MNCIQKKLYTLLFVALVLPKLGTAQDTPSGDFTYEVNKVYPSISITKDKLTEAQSIADLNKYYKPSWVKEYRSVEISTSHNGSIKKIVSTDGSLNAEQRENMLMADAGSDITVLVQYIPENNLKHNDLQKIDFTFTVDPDKDATYPGGQEQLMAYLNEQAIAKIAEGTFEGYDLTAVKFTIEEDGGISNAHIFDPVMQADKDEATEKLLLETICNMDNWEPAEYANGQKVKQEYVLTVGNMSNCIVPLLSINKDLPE